MVLEHNLNFNIVNSKVLLVDADGERTLCVRRAAREMPTVESLVSEGRH